MATDKQSAPAELPAALAVQDRQGRVRHVLLWMRQDCPYCQKVLRYAAGRALALPLVDIGHHAAARERLVAFGGKAQVPCLSLDGQPLYESEAIIAQLGELTAP